MAFTYLAGMLLGIIPEEYLFRRMAIPFYSEKNVLFAIILSGLLFELVHLDKRGLMPFLLNTGLLYGIIYVISGKLWLTILFHFIYNASTIILGLPGIIGHTWLWFILSAIGFLALLQLR